MKLSRAQQLIIDGLQENPAEFAEALEDLDRQVLGDYMWLRCVVAGVSARFMETRWPFTPSGFERHEAVEAAKNALLARYAVGYPWLDPVP